MKLENEKLLKNGRQPISLPAPFVFDQKQIDSKRAYYENEFKEKYQKKRF